MLHFLIGLALCIWIAERITRRRREHRLQIRNLREGLRLARPWQTGAEIDKYVDDVYGAGPSWFGWRSPRPSARR